MAKKDHVDRVLSDWAVEKPEYDLTPVAIVGRMARIMEYVDQAQSENFGRFGISRASFDVLATLRRSGPPYRMTQRELMTHLLRTSGSISVRIDALSRAGLVTREAAGHDRRNVVVALTREGHQLLETVIPEHLRTEENLLFALEPKEKKTLVTLLSKLLQSLEESNAQPSHEILGIQVLPPRSSLHRRRAVGLPDVTGLLVQDVLAGSLAESAGLRRGDLITNIGDTRIDTVATLRKALTRITTATKIGIVRGADSLTLTPTDLRNARST